MPETRTSYVISELLNWKASHMSETSNLDNDASIMDLPLWADPAARDRLLVILAKHRVPPDVLTDLVREQRDRQDQARAHGVNSAFEEIIGRMDD